MRSLLSFAVLSLTLLTPLAWAAAPDARVKTALDQVQETIPLLKYEVDGDGDYKLVVVTGSSRTQIVFINSATETWEGIEIREIWSPAFPTKSKKFPVKTANMLLQDSQNKKLGAWQAYPQNKGWFAVFNVKVGADTDAASLASLVRYVAIAADNMEAQVLGSDNF